MKNEVIYCIIKNVETLCYRIGFLKTGVLAPMGGKILLCGPETSGGTKDIADPEASGGLAPENYSDKY